MLFWGGWMRKNSEQKAEMTYNRKQNPVGLTSTARCSLPPSPQHADRAVRGVCRSLITRVWTHDTHSTAQTSTAGKLQGFQLFGNNKDILIQFNDDSKKQRKWWFTLETPCVVCDTQTVQASSMTAVEQPQPISECTWPIRLPNTRGTDRGERRSNSFFLRR